MPEQKLKRCEQTQACLLSTSWMTSQRMKSQIFNNNKIVKIVIISFLSSATYTLPSESTDLKQQLSKHLAYVDCIMSGFYASSYRTQLHQTTAWRVEAKWRRAACAVRTECSNCFLSASMRASRLLMVSVYSMTSWCSDWEEARSSASMRCSFFTSATASRSRRWAISSSDSSSSIYTSVHDSQQKHTLHSERHRRLRPRPASSALVTTLTSQ